MTQVNEPSQAYQDQVPKWQRIKSLLDGTEAMRRAGKTYMPKFPLETDDDYARRLQSATLAPYFSGTVKNMSDRVFYQPIDTEEVADELADDLDNIDLNGRDLNTVAYDWFRKGLAYGMCSVLVDAPQAMNANRSQADEARENQRPYIRIVQPQEIIGWIVDRVNNIDTLVQVRIAETATVRDGEYGTKDVERIRVITPDAFEVWEKQEDSGYELIESGTNPLGEIPLVTFYTERENILRAESPLEHLSHLNIKHWQEQSDQDESVKFARVRMVYATGLDPETTISASSDSIINLPENGTMEVVQGSAESVNVGADSLSRLEDQMREAGAKLLRKEGSTNKTVAQAVDDAIVERSALGRMADGLEDAINQVLGLMARLRGIQDGGTVDVNSNYTLEDNEVTAESLVKLTTAGVISNQLAFEQAKKREIVVTDQTWEEEQERIQTEMPDERIDAEPR